MRQLLAAIAVLAPLLLAMGMNYIQFHDNSTQIYALAIFVSTVLLWIGELLPLPTTALLVPVLITVYGVAPASSAFSQFSNGILFLFLGAFLLAQGMHKHRLDERIAFNVLLSPIGGGSIIRLGVGIAGTCFVLSMWVSNTATIAMMCPVVIGISAVLCSANDNSENQRITAFLLLCAAYSASIGGISTPIGSPPNLIAIGLLKQQGISVGFLDWMKVGFPLACLLLLSSFAILVLFFRMYSCGGTDPEALQQEFRNRLHSLGKITRAELATMCCFAVAVFLWLAPDIFSLLFPEHSVGPWFKQHLPMSIVALAAGLALFFIPKSKNDSSTVLEWPDAAAIDWGTIMLFGGGLCLGHMLESTGLSKLIGSYLLSSTGTNYFFLTIVAAAVAIFLTEVASNTASATIVIAILLGTLQTNSSEALGPIFAAAICCSCSFMLPVATPPNAIVYGSRKIQLKQMLRVGLLLNASALILICGFILLTF